MQCVFQLISINRENSNRYVETHTACVIEGCLKMASKSGRNMSGELTGNKEVFVQQAGIELSSRLDGI